MFELRGHSLLRNEKGSKIAKQRSSSASAGLHNGDSKVLQKNYTSGKMKFGTDDSFRKGLQSTELVSRVDKVNDINCEHSRKMQRRNISESELVKNLKEQIACLEEQVECLKKQQLLHNKLLKPEFLTTLTPTKQISPIRKSAIKHSDVSDNVKTTKCNHNHQNSTNKTLFNSTVLEEELSKRTEEVEHLVNKLPYNESKCESCHEANLESISALDRSNLLLLQLRNITLEDELAVVKKAKESALEEFADARVKLNSMSLELIQSNKERDTLRHQIQQLRSQREAHSPITKNVVKIAAVEKQANANNDNETIGKDVAFATKEHVENLLHQREFYKMQTDRLQGETELLQTQMKMLRERILSESAKLISTEVRLRATEDEVQCLKIIAERFNLLCANNKHSVFDIKNSAGEKAMQKSYDHSESELKRHDQNHKNDYGFVNAVHELKEWEHELEQSLHDAREQLHSKQSVEQPKEAEKALLIKNVDDKTNNVDDNVLKQLEEEHNMTNNQVIDNNVENIKNFIMNGKNNNENEEHQQEYQEHTNEYYNNINHEVYDNDNDDDSVVILNEEALENDERSSHSLVTKEIEEERQELKVQGNNTNTNDDNLLDISHKKESINDTNRKQLENANNRNSSPITELVAEHVHRDNDNNEEAHDNCVITKSNTVLNEHDLQEQRLHENTQEQECTIFTNKTQVVDAAATANVVATAELSSTNLLIPLPPPALVPLCPPAVLPDKIASCCCSVDDQAATNNDKIVSLKGDNAVHSSKLTGVKNDIGTNLENLQVNSGVSGTNVIDSSTTEIIKSEQHNVIQAASAVAITTVPVPQSVPVAEMSILDQLRALESEIAAEEVSLQLFLHKHKEEETSRTVEMEARENF